MLVRQENRVLKKKIAQMYQPGRVIRTGIGIANFIIGLMLL